MDLERLEKIVNTAGKKVQIIFAGKAHPRDNPGKDLIRQIVHTSRSEQFRKSLVFLEDYDINVARYIVQGVDVWLNTPLRPMEASGTSGMKVAANGGLNVSIPDGWWAEGYHPSVGWSIGAGEEYDDLEYQDSVESQALYNLLEKEIIPLFYDRGTDNLPRKWIAMMKAAIGKLAPVYSTNRMVRQYAERFYAPAAVKWEELTPDNMRAAREMSSWKHKLTSEFGGVKIEAVTDNIDSANTKIGNDLQIEAVIDVGNLNPDDLDGELFYGTVNDDGQLGSSQTLQMHHCEQIEKNKHRYHVEMPCDHTGMTGYTVRIIPAHNSQRDTRISSLVRWA